MANNSEIKPLMYIMGFPQKSNTDLVDGAINVLKSVFYDKTMEQVEEETKQEKAGESRSKIAGDQWKELGEDDVEKNKSGELGGRDRDLDH